MARRPTIPAARRRTRKLSTVRLARAALRGLGLAWLAWLFAPVSQAETLQLRDGRQIQAKIVRRTESLVTVEWQPGWTEDIPLRAIAQIDGENVGGKVTQADSVGYDWELLQWGLRFKPPDDWARRKQADRQAVLFYSPGHKATINVAVKAMDEAAYQSWFATVHQVKQPVTVGVVPGNMLVEEKAVAEGGRVKVKTYILYRYGKLCVINLTAGAGEEFERYAQIFDKSMATVDLTE